MSPSSPPFSGCFSPDAPGWVSSRNPPSPSLSRLLLRPLKASPVRSLEVFSPECVHLKVFLFCFLFFLSRSYGPVRWLPHIQPSPPPALLCSSDGSCPRSPSWPLNPTCCQTRRRGAAGSDGGSGPFKVAVQVTNQKSERGWGGRGTHESRPMSVFHVLEPGWKLLSRVWVMNPLLVLILVTLNSSSVYN